MTEKNTKAKKLFWQTLTPVQKSAIMSIRRTKGWAKKTKAERLAHGRKLTDARLAKAKAKLSTV